MKGSSVPRAGFQICTLRVNGIKLKSDESQINKGGSGSGSVLANSSVNNPLSSEEMTRIGAGNGALVIPVVEEGCERLENNKDGKDNEADCGHCDDSEIENNEASISNILDERESESESESEKKVSHEDATEAIENLRKYLLQHKCPPGIMLKLNELERDILKERLKSLGNKNRSTMSSVEKI